MMRKRFISIAVAVFLAVAGILWASPSVAAQRGNNNQNKVTICHATGSSSNPFVRITVAAAGAFNGHMGNHHQDGRDIIPPFTFRGQTHSQNWNAEGQAIWNNDCEIPHDNGDNGNGNGVSDNGRGGVVLGVTAGGVAQAPQVEAPLGAVDAGLGGGNAPSNAAVIGLLSSLAVTGLGLRSLLGRLE